VIERTRLLERPHRSGFARPEPVCFSRLHSCDHGVYFFHTGTCTHSMP
jgi:hypothetical protein